MSAAHKLYDAARQYCVARHAHWFPAYRKLLDQDKARIGSEYTDQAYDTLPRYHAVAAILSEIERLDAGRLPEEAELRELLVVAGHCAESLFTRNAGSEIERAAILDERHAFEKMIRSISHEDLARVEALPYRRVLSPDEVSGLWTQLKQRWGADGGYYYPLADRKEPSLLAFSTESFDKRFSPVELRQILRSLGVSRVYELREHGDENYLLDVDAWEPFYNGAEGFWFSEELEWILYCSHESSTTVGGTLTDAILGAWEYARDHEWTSCCP
jgi:hypothetical protein